jgi:integrase
MALPDLYVSPVATSIERWLASYPARTSETYRESLLLAVRVMSDTCARGIHDVDWTTFDDAHLAALRERMAATYAPNTVNRTLAAIRSLARRLRRDHLIDGDQLASLNTVRSLPRTRVHERVSLTDTEQRLVMNACKELRAPVFHQAIVALMLGGGLRSDETIRLVNARPFVRVKVRLLKDAGDVLEFDVVGKGRKSRSVYLVGHAGRAALRFFGDTRGDDRHGYYTPLTTQILVARCRALARKARVRMFTPHDLRRTFASNMLRRADIVTVQQMMGHADPKQTAEYDVRSEERLASAAFDPWGE